MSIEFLLLTTSVACAIVVSYLVAVRYIQRRRAATEKFGVIGRRRLAQRITGSRLRWIKADELKRLIKADPELVVFHLLDDDPSEAASEPFETEIGVTLPQLEEALPWMPRGTRFAVYQVNGIAAELAHRIYSMTQGCQVLLLAGRSSFASERCNGRFAGQIFS